MTIPILEVGPRLVLLETEGYTRRSGRFCTWPGDPDADAVVAMVSQSGTVIQASKWKHIDLEAIYAFCAGACVISVHPKRVLGNLAHWRGLNGDTRADVYYNTFMNVNDLAYLVNAPDAQISLEERLSFNMNNVCRLLGYQYDSTMPASFEIAVSETYKLCQKIRSVR